MDQNLALKAKLEQLLSPTLAPLLDELLNLTGAFGAMDDPAGAIRQQLAGRPDLAALIQQVNTNLIDLGSAQVGDVAVGDVAGNNLFKLVVQWYGARSDRPFSRSPLPAAPEHYITRPTYERALAEALTHPERRLAVLSGLSGAGKTALAITVVRHLVAHNVFSDDKQPSDGTVFWGDLSVYTAGEQVWNFLLELDRHEAGSAQTAWQNQHRAIFWRLVKETPALIVLDNVTDARQLNAILPARAQDLGSCRVLILSPTALSVDAFAHTLAAVQLGAFDSAEAAALFQAVLGRPYVALYREDLSAVAQGLEYFPHLVAAAALAFKQGVVSPTAYRQRLRERRAADGQGSIAEGLMQALAALDADAQQLFPLIGACGAGSWSPALLAAVAIQPLPLVQQALTTLSRRGLIEHTPQRRYRANGFVRTIAASRLAERGAYAYDVAHTLAARHLLDRAQGLIATLSQTPEVGGAYTAAFVQRFNERMLPEIAHLRHSLDWAVERAQWELVRRFSEANAFELAWDLTANGVGFQLTFQFATLAAPLIQRRAAERYLRTRALLTGSNLVIDERMERMVRDGPLIEANGFDLVVGAGADAEEPPAGRFEVILDICAGQILDGVIADVTLIEASWTAVRAANLVLDQVDLSGARLLGCDLGRAMFLLVDARRTVFHGSLMEEALIRGGTWRGADLAGVDLRGATIAGAPGRRVDLRGVNLRGASLRDARLTRVDLRGADLREVDATGCTLDDCLLKGVLLDGSIWTLGGESDDASEENRVARSEIARLRVSAPAAGAATARPGAGGSSRADLRAAQPAGSALLNTSLIRADLRAADLRGINLEYRDLSGANLVHARLEGAQLASARLPAARLRGATLAGAFFTAANLSGADLSESDCRGADFSRAQLVGATFCFADLSGADLSDADLSDADLRMARIDRARLLPARSLAGAWLPGGQRVALLDRIPTNLDGLSLQFVHCTDQFTGENIDWTGKDLYGACLSGHFARVIFYKTNLQGAKFRESRFNQCDFRDSSFVDAQIEGRFTECNLQRVDFTRAKLKGTSFVGSDLRGALVDNTQLQQAYALRDSWMPGGTWYDGRFQLEGDLQSLREFAEESKNNPEDLAFINWFYSRRSPT